MDEPRNEIIFDLIKEFKPESVIEVCPRWGHLLRKLNTRLGVKIRGIEPNFEVYLNRTCKDIIHWDVGNIPWPVREKEFDLIFTDRVLEAVPTGFVDQLVGEIKRISKRGLHITARPDLAKALGDQHRAMPIEATFKDGALFYNGGVLKLNFGSGKHMFRDGWSNIDIEPMGAYSSQCFFRYALHDIRNRIPALDNTVTVIMLSHLLEHLGPQEYEQILADCWRVLAVGGVIRLSFIDDSKVTPDFAFHKSILDSRITKYQAADLMKTLEKLGFCRVKLSNFQESECKTIQAEAYDTLADISVYIEARKLVL